jgi:hypothetical protein
VTANPTNFIADIAGTRPGLSRSRLKERRDPQNPANPAYRSLERPTTSGDAAYRFRSSQAFERTYEPPDRAQTAIQKLWRSNEAKLTQPVQQRERRDFRVTNCVDDIDGARSKLGRRMAEGTLARRQLNPVDPQYDWETRDRWDGMSERVGIMASGKADGRAAGASSARAAEAETHFSGAGMTLISRHYGDYVPPIVRSREQRAELLASRLHPAPSRAQRCASTMAASLSVFHPEGRPAAQATSAIGRSGRIEALMPPARDPARMADRSLLNSDIPFATAHRAHRDAAGDGARVRRTIRDPMVLLPDAKGARGREDDALTRYPGLQFSSGQ